MQVGDIRRSDAVEARHQNRQGVECGSRSFVVNVVGVSGLYGAFGHCVLCHKEARIYEDGIVAFGRWSTYRL